MVRIQTKHHSCQCGNAAWHGQPKNWCGAGAGRIADAISVVWILILKNILLTEG